MLSFSDYSSKRVLLNARIDILEQQLDYRIVQLIGPGLPDPCKHKFSQYEEDRIDRDPTVIRLRYCIKILKYKLEYLKATGELPPEEDTYADRVDFGNS